jgi:hypothetical protein
MSGESKSDVAKIVGRTREGILVGKIANLVAEGSIHPDREADTFLRAVMLIREYGDERMKEMASVH